MNNFDEIVCHLTETDLITSVEATTQGFAAQAEAKRKYAIPHLQAAKLLREKLFGIEDVEILLLRLQQDRQLRADLITAAGYSDKSVKHLRDRLDALLEQFLRDTFSAFQTPEDACIDIVDRYILTRGDTLGGSIRNWIGANAKAQLTDSVLKALHLQGYTDLTQTELNLSATENTPTTVKQKIRGIAWKERLLLFDATPSTIKKIIANDATLQENDEQSDSQRKAEKNTQAGKRRNNVDVILLKVPSDLKTIPKVKQELDQLHSGKYYALIKTRILPVHYKTLLENTDCLLACGELKGGIDPAGADEHWKTAISALGPRIRDRFDIPDLKLFFIGAAIESAMAQEIVREIKEGKLTYAANLTKQEQVHTLANWLISL